MYNYYGPSQKQQKVKQPNLALIIYLGELPRDIDQYELDQFIKLKGDFDIESLTVKPTKENKSFAYVKFKNKSQAEEALKKLHLCSLKNHIIRAEPFKSKEKTDLPKDNSTNVFVKNLPPETSSKELYDLFSAYGKINSINLKRKEENVCLGYGYVDFENAESAQNAIENLNNSVFKDKNIVVTNFFSKKKKGEEEKLPLVTVKNLPENLQESNNLKEFLMKYGEISLCSVINTFINKNGMIEEDLSKMNPQKSEMIGLALFDNKQNALNAIKNLNGKILDSNMKPFYIALSPINKFVMDKLLMAKNENFKEKYQGCNLVAKNLAKDIKDKHLYEIFKEFGEIKTARIATEGVMKDKMDEQGNIIDKEFVYESKGFGFVLFKKPEDASRAIEALNNKTIEFNGLKLKPSIEYYDYSKSKSNDNQFPNKNQNIHSFSSQRNPNFNNQQKFNNQNQRNMYQMNNNPNMNQRNFKQINQYQQNEMMRQRNEYQQQQMFQQNQNIPMNRNEIQQQMQQNMQYQQNLNQNRFNQNQNNQMQPKNTTNIQQTTTNKEIVELNKNIQKIFTSTNIEERTEQLGEIIFYFLHEFIQKHNLNVIPNFDDTILCSKLTGILINEDDNEILEILSTNESIIMFIKNVVMKLTNANEGNN